MLFSGKNKDSGINSNAAPQEKRSLSIDEQLFLFQSMQTHSRLAKQQTEEADRVKNSVARIRAVIFIQPEMDHNCSTINCSPISEAVLIARRILSGSPIHPDVFVCRYGRHHVCNSRYRECVIVMDNTQQCTCRITGRFYGLGGAWQIGGGGNNAGAEELANDQNGDYFMVHDTAAGFLDDDDAGVDVVTAEKPFTFDDYAIDADMGGGGSDGEGDYEGSGGNSHHPFNPPTAFNQVMHTNNSKFISKITDANIPTENVLQQKSTSKLAVIPSLPSLANLLTVQTTTTTTTTTTKKRDIKTTIIQNSSPIGRPSKRARTLVNIPISLPPITAAVITTLHNSNTLQQVTPDQLNMVINIEYTKRREDIQEILNCLFYSTKRTQIGSKELRVCMDSAKKAVNGTIRTIRDKQLKHLPVVIPLYDIMVTYYTHITVAHTLLTLAPRNPTFIEQAINIIMFLWRRVVKFHLTHNLPYTKLQFIQHCLAVFYEMRKGGRILKESEIIPDSTYIRMYMPSIELIEQFGYKKNFITLGFKTLLQAYK